MKENIFDFAKPNINVLNFIFYIFLIKNRYCSILFELCSNSVLSLLDLFIFLSFFLSNIKKSNDPLLVFRGLYSVINLFPQPTNSTIIH